MRAVEAGAGAGAGAGMMEGGERPTLCPTARDRVTDHRHASAAQA